MEVIYIAISKAQQKAVAKYTKANYDNIYVRVPKGRRETVEEIAAQRGGSVNALINELLSGAAGLSMEEWKNTED